MKQILIVGANGQVGAALDRYRTSTSGVESVLRASRTGAPGWLRLDLGAMSQARDAAALLDGKELSAIVCVAGWTYVDGCETDPERAFQINAHGPAALAAYAHGRGIRFVYYSTDYLFDGTPEHPGPYLEDEAPRPLNVYGHSKLAGEEAVLRAHPGALVLRTAGVYGMDAQEKNFLYTVLHKLSAGDRLRVPVDQVSTPTWNTDLAEATFALLEGGHCGTFHVCGPQAMDRLALARRIALHFDLSTAGLVGVPTAELSQTARRPLLAGLDSEKLKGIYPKIAMHPLEAALDACSESIMPRLAEWTAERRLLRRQAVLRSTE